MTLLLFQIGQIAKVVSRAAVLYTHKFARIGAIKQLQRCVGRQKRREIGDAWSEPLGPITEASQLTQLADSVLAC